MEKLTYEWLLSEIRANSSVAGDCWLWRGKTRGPGYAYLYHEENTRYFLLHVLISTLRGDDRKECVRHLCDNKLCVNPQHIVTGTHKENRQDSVKNGTQPVNIRNGAAKLNDEIVAWIRAQPKAHRSDAVRMGISWTHYLRVRKGTRWTYVGA